MLKMAEILENKLFLATTIVIVAIYVYLKFYVYNYWRRHGVPCEPPSIPLGNIPISHFFNKISFGNFISENYVKFCKHPFHGFYAFHKPILVINDPELIRIVLVKEFQSFQNRGWFYNRGIDELSANLFILPGEKWKKLRAKLSPTFTSGKLKQMYPLFCEISNNMIDTCEAALKQSDVVEMKDLFARYAIDIIASIVFGLKPNSLQNPEDEFRINGIKSSEVSKLGVLAAMLAPEFLEKLAIPIFQDSTRKFFLNTFRNIVDYRHKEKIVRKDFLNLLMQLMYNGEVEDDEKKTFNGIKNNLEKLNLVEATAQAFVFFIAGFETASSTATYALLELAMNPEIQDKLRKEADEMTESMGINYDSVMGNEYLDMVITETLRKHPSLPVLNRVCEEDFLIPNSSFTIPKGMRVMISTSGIYRNPEFYPNPETFDPMRFSKENAATRSNYVHLQFGEGPRFCIGKRFGLLQAKQAVVTMLRNYKFYISDKTQIPVKYTTLSLLQIPESGVYLRLEKRNLNVEDCNMNLLL